MNAMIVVLFAMEFVSLMLAVILVTAWNSFGRPRHALTWCTAFVVAAIAWAGYIVLLASYPGDWRLSFAAGLLSMATWAIMLLGFRQRVGQPTALMPTISLAAAAVGALTLSYAAGQEGLNSGIPLFFSATMLGLCARTMMFRGGRGPAERAVITMLLAFAMLDLIASGISVYQGGIGRADGDPILEMLMMLTLPSAFTGTGLFAVFLLAADLAERMGKLAASDPLTRVLNRRGFEDAAHRALAHARRQRQAITVVVADLDRFKTINDRFGHAVGDRALCRFVEHVNKSIRADDVLGRIGGEEFAILLVGAEPEVAMEAIDRFRVTLGQVDITTPSGVVHITASFGVTGPSGPDDTLEAMLARADAALYQAKVSGRDRVTLILATAPPPPRLAVPTNEPVFIGTAAR